MKPALAGAAASIGGLGGYLTATTSFHPHVVSAAVTALLAGLIGWIVLAIKKGTIEPALVPSFFSIMFCVCFWLALNVEFRLQEWRDVERTAKEAVLRYTYFHETLAQCSEIELRTNLGRKAVGLDPLRNGFVCEAMMLEQ